MVGSRPDFGAELGGERLRLSDAPKLGAVAGGAPVRRQRGRSQLGRFQCSRRDRSRDRRPADRLGRRRRLVLRQRRVDAGRRRCGRRDAPAPSNGQAARTDVPRDAAGIVFLARHPMLRWIVLAFFVTAVFARPYRQLIPAFTENVLHAGPRGLGWAVSAIGVGGFGGALVTAYFGQRRAAIAALAAGRATDVVRNRRARIRSDALAIALPVLFLIGIGTMALLGCDEHADPNALARRVRGRALAVYTMIAIGVVPAGSLVDGAIAAVDRLARDVRPRRHALRLTFLAIWLFTKPSGENES